MLDDEKRAEFDRLAQEAGEVMPMIWKAMYSELKQRFTKEEAFELLKVYIHGVSGGSWT